MKAAVGFGKGVIFDFTSSPPHLTDGQPCAAQLRMELGNLLIVVEASIKCYDVGLNKKRVDFLDFHDCNEVKWVCLFCGV